jgi:hypothetical protein
MNEIDRYQISSENGIGYNQAIEQYLLSRFDMVTSFFNLSGSEISPQTRISDSANFISAIVKSIPIYFTEQFAPSSKFYSSLRGAGYSEMSLALAEKSLLDKGGVETIKLNHEFRASANALDAIVDESDKVLTREDTRDLPIRRL